MKSILLPIAFLFVFQICHAQTTYMLAEDGVKVSVKGASTLHDWEAVASEVIYQPTEIKLVPGLDNGFENLSFKVGVESLDGGRGASMNKKIRKALISSENPYIVFEADFFELTSTASIDEPILNAKVRATGSLQIAGKLMDVEVEAKANVIDEQLIISGSKALKMSDFDIEPPTAMFGQIKTRDDITVVFEFRYDQK